ncbi:MAG: hypothetical protein HQL31_10030, partial [Planctomycetes bacterium]|nr:hypothetical protein [Planctomycetota bacterium]
MPYYIVQWQRYTQACDDDLQARLAGPVTRSLERFLRDRGQTGSGLIGWHLGCNSFLYQADHLNLPGEGFSPSVMVALMRRALAEAATASGDAAMAQVHLRAADEVERELLRRFWDSSRGAFIPGIDQGGLAQRLALYTDFVFPALYSRLPRAYAWCCLEAADRRLWSPGGLFRMGELLPSGFGNDMVGVVQPSEAAEAYAELGRSDCCFALLPRTAEALTT